MTPPPNHHGSRSKHWGMVFLLSLVALILAHCTALIYRIQPAVSLWFPPSGIAIVLTLWFGPVGILATAVTSVLMAPLWGSEGWTRLLGLTDTVEPFLAWLLYRQVWQGSLRLKSLRDAAAFTLSGPLIACAASAVLGSLMLVITAQIPAAKLTTIIPHWWLGNALGTIAIVPSALLVLTPRLQRWGWLPVPSCNQKDSAPSTSDRLPPPGEILAPFRCTPREVVAILTFSTATGVFAVSNTSSENLAFQQLSFLSFVPIIWAATRFGVIGGMLTSTFSVLVTLLAYLLIYPQAMSAPSFPVPPEVLHIHKLSLLLQCAVSLFVGCATSQQAAAQVALAIERVRMTEYQARAELSDRLAEANLHLEESNQEKDRLLKREQAARQQLSKLLQSITDAFFALDNQWRFTYVNHQAAQHFRKSEAELLGQSIWQSFPDAVDTPFDHEYRRAVAQQVTVNFEAFYAPFEIWVEVHGYPSADGLSVFFRDISDRKRLEAEVYWRQQQFTALAENSPDIISRLNRDHRHIYVNPAIKRATGQPPQTLIGKTHTELGLPAERCKQWQETLQTIFATGQEQRIEFDFLTPDGNLHYYQARMVPEFAQDGSVETVMGVARDITELKQTEAALRKSERRLRRIVDSNIIGVFFGDLSGNITEANDAFLKIVGYTHPDILAGWVCWEQITPPEYLHRYQQAIAQLRVQGSCEPFEKELIRKDGSRVFVMIGGALLEPTQEEAVCYAIDISARKRAEDSQREAEERLQVALKNSPITLFNQDRELRYFWLYNPAWNHRIEDVLGKQDSELLLNGDAEVLTQIKRGVLETGEGSRQEVKVTFDGRERYFDLTVEPLRDGTGEIVGVTCAAFDISDRQQAEEALRYLAETSIVLSASLDYEATLRKAAQIAVPKLADWCSVEVFAEDGSLRRLPVAYADESKGELAQLLQQYPPNPQGSSPIARVLRSGQSELISELPEELLVANTWNQEHLRLVHGMGMQSAMIVPLVAHGRILGTMTFVASEVTHRYSTRDLALAEDLARRVALAIENAKAHREAQEANRIKDEFLAVLSHELRSPLNPILGWVTLLRSRKLSQEKTASALEAIERNAKLQVQLIEDLLDISRILQGKINLSVTAVNLATVVEAAIDTVKLAAEAKSIQIQLRVASEMGVVAGDAGRLQQVVWNLLSNAIKFTEVKGRIEVRLWREGGNQADPAFACLQVSDSGIGIQPEFLPFVFEHFRQADASITRKHGGLGLGLAIARYLVELHGGTIQVFSEGLGQGATFTIKLPMMKVQPEVQVVAEGTKGMLSLTGVRVLVVDDEPDTREFLSFVLEDYGAQVKVADSVREAVAVWPEFQPTLLVSDIGMPEADGYELIRKVRLQKWGGDCPAIALTAYAREEDSRQALEAGFQLHLSKPVEPEELVGAIDALVRGY